MRKKKKNLGFNPAAPKITVHGVFFGFSSKLQFCHYTLKFSL